MRYPTIPLLILFGSIFLLFLYLKLTGYSVLDSFRPRDREYHQSRLVGVLLGLDDASLDELLGLYNNEFGNGATRYARKTFRKWKSGKVQPSTQTFERFLVHLPKVMTYDLKCEVLRHFMQECTGKDKYELNVHTDDWEEKLAPLVKQIIDKAYTAELPVEVERKLKWLGDGDMQAAQKLLQASQIEEGKMLVSRLREEFDGIERLLAEKQLNPKVRHIIELPYGTIEMSIRRR